MVLTMNRTTCLVCGASGLSSILDLGMHPFADTFLKYEELADGEKVYPLVCDLCGSCGQIQLQSVTDPKERYIDHEYSYTSANSAVSRKHWQEYSQAVAQRVALSASGLVVEIGSNDGFLAEQ